MSARTASLTTAKRSVRGQVSREEWRIRVDLAACYRLIAHYRWDDLVFTHISARVPGPERAFLLNPYGMMFQEITASSLVKVDFDGNVLIPSEHGINLAGYTIHSAIQMARPDVTCVIHLHSRDGAAVSAQKDGLLPLTQTAMIARAFLAYHDYEGIALDLGERERLVSDLGDKCLMMLRNHGTLACGPSVAEAFARMFTSSAPARCRWQPWPAAASSPFPPRRCKSSSHAKCRATRTPTGRASSPGRRSCACWSARTRATRTRRAHAEERGKAPQPPPLVRRGRFRYSFRSCSSPTFGTSRCPASV